MRTVEKIRTWITPSRPEIEAQLSKARVRLEHAEEEHGAELLAHGTADPARMETEQKEIRRLELLLDAMRRAAAAEVESQKTADAHALAEQRRADRASLAVAARKFEAVLQELETSANDLAERMRKAVAHDDSIASQVSGAMSRIPWIVASRLKVVGAKQATVTIDTSEVSKYLPRAEAVKE